jgi:SAM-dependent methyltransferase
MLADAVHTSSGATRRATSSASPSSAAGGPHYARAGKRPGCHFADASFDGVVACLVFEHIDDVDGAIAEVARVLRGGGRFAFFLNHPLLQTPRQRLDSTTRCSIRPSSTGASGRISTRRTLTSRSSSGVYIRFLHRPLSRYLNALTDHGLVLERNDRTPRPPPGFLALASEYALAASIPRLLYLRLPARRPSVDSRHGGDRPHHRAVRGGPISLPRRFWRTSASMWSTTCRVAARATSSNLRSKPVGGIDRLALV